MDRDAVRAFASRDWAALEALDRRHWARRHREEGPEATFGAGQALREYVRRVRPDWPTPRDRAADLEHHVATKRLLERVGRALAGR